MNFIKSLKYIIILYVLVIGACRPVKTIQKDALQPVPGSFANNSDSLSSATISWKNYFKDEILIKLIDTALVANFDALTAYQRIQAANSDVLVAKGDLKPTVNAIGAASLRRFGLYTMDGAGNITTPIYDGRIVPVDLPDYYLGLQTAWEIDVWGKLKNRKRAAMARFLSSIEGRNLILTNIVAEVSNAYYELLTLDVKLAIIDTTIILQQNALEIVKAQKEAAAANELAVKQFEAQLLNLRAMRLGTLQEITETESKINFLLGRFPQTITRDTSQLTRFFPEKVRSGVPSALLQNRPDIRQAELEVLASKADVQAARAAFYPSLTINATVGFQAFKTALLFTTPESFAYSLFGTLTAPLINRSAIKAEFNRANAAQLEALYNYQKSIVNGFIEVYNEMQKADRLGQLYELKQLETEALSQSIEISIELFKTGMADYLEVLIAQQNALQAKLELVEVKKNQFIVAVNLYKALGGGWR